VAPSVHCRKLWLTPTTRVPCSNAAKMRNPWKFAGVFQKTPEPISAVSGPKFAILCSHVEEILLFKTFLPIVDTCLNCEDIAGQSCAMVPRWRIFGPFLHPVFSASNVHHVSYLHSKFALRPHHVWKYARHPIVQSPTAEMRRGKKKKNEEKEKEERKKKPQGKYSIRICYAGRP